MTKINFKIKKEELENSRLKIVVTVPAKDFESVKDAATAKVLSEAKLNGFRDGKVPLEAFKKAYGEFPIYQEMGYLMVDKTYVEVIVGEKIEAIGKPEISILKVVPGEDFEYQIVTDVLPEVTLGDYKKYHKEFELDKIEEPKEDEINDAVEELRRMRIKKGENGEEIMPEVNEEFLKSVGDFKTLEDLKKVIRTNLENEKKWRAEEKRKGQIFEKIISETKTAIPKSLVENELLRMEERVRGDLSQMGVTFEDYLKHLKKSLTEWKEAETKTAEKNVILQLALLKIGKDEKLKVSDETINHEVAHLLEHYPSLDKERAKAYTEEKMTNSFVAEFVLTGKVPNEKELFGSHEGHNH